MSGKLGTRDILLLALLAAIPLLGYQFAIGNQVEQLSLIIRANDPGYLPRDFYVNEASGFGPRFYYAQLVAGMNKLASLPALFIVLTCLTNFALACATYIGARRLLKASEAAAAIAALVVVLNSSFSLGLASSIRFESYQPANPAIVLAIAGFILLVSNRHMFAALAFAGSAILHPLIGLEVAAIAWGACGLASLLRARSGSDVISIVRRYAPALALFGVAVFVAWGLPSLGHSQAKLPDADFFAILPEFRAPHHYLASHFPDYHYRTAFFFLAATLWLLAARIRADGWTFELSALLLTIAIIVLACIASFVLVDVLHSRAAATAQVFRMLFLLKWVGLVVFAYSAADWMRRGDVLGWVAALAPILATQEAQPAVLLGAVIAIEAVRYFKFGRVERWLGAGLLALFAFVIVRGDGSREEAIRIAFGLVCVAAWFAPQRLRVAAQASAAASIVVAISVAVWNRDANVIRSPTFHPIYTWSDHKGPEADAAAWAKANSDPASLWIAPPDVEAFRLLAQRSVVVDYTSIPFSDKALREWRERMSLLYGPVSQGGFIGLSEMKAYYRHVPEAELLADAKRLGADYALLYADTPISAPPLYANAEYKIVRLSHQ